MDKKEYRAIWRKNNKDKIKKYGAKWYQKNKLKHDEDTKRWRKNNPERLKELAREGYARRMGLEYKPKKYSFCRDFLLAIHEQKDDVQMILWSHLESLFLTDKQAEILKLVKQGLNITEIADQLNSKQPLITKAINGNNGYGGIYRKFAKLVNKNTQLNLLIAELKMNWQQP